MTEFHIDCPMWGGDDHRNFAHKNCRLKHLSSSSSLEVFPLILFRRAPEPWSRPSLFMSAALAFVAFAYSLCLRIGVVKMHHRIFPVEVFIIWVPHFLRYQFYQMLSRSNRVLLTARHTVNLFILILHCYIFCIHCFDVTVNHNRAISGPCKPLRKVQSVGKSQWQSVRKGLSQTQSQTPETSA